MSFRLESGMEKKVEWTGFWYINDTEQINFNGKMACVHKLLIVAFTRELKKKETVWDGGIERLPQEMQQTEVKYPCSALGSTGNDKDTQVGTHELN